MRLRHTQKAVIIVEQLLYKQFMNISNSRGFIVNINLHIQ